MFIKMNNTIIITRNVILTLNNSIWLSSKTIQFNTSVCIFLTMLTYALFTQSTNTTYGSWTNGKKKQITTMMITNELEEMILCVGDHEGVLG
jgi:hypothetical protein